MSCYCGGCYWINQTKKYIFNNNNFSIPFGAPCLTQDSVIIRLAQNDQSLSNFRLSIRMHPAKHRAAVTHLQICQCNVMFDIYKVLLRKTVKALEGLISWRASFSVPPENVIVCGVSQILRKFVPQSWCRCSETMVTELCPCLSEQLACLRQKPWLIGHWCSNWKYLQGCLPCTNYLYICCHIQSLHPIDKDFNGTRLSGSR